MPANLELKTSDYTEHAITMYYNGYSLHWFIFLVVHTATYVPSSITHDAVSAAAGSSRDGSIWPQGFPWGMPAIADCATHPHQSLFLLEAFVYSLGWRQELVLLERSMVFYLLNSLWAFNGAGQESTFTQARSAGTCSIILNEILMRCLQGFPITWPICINRSAFFSRLQ